MKSVGKGRSLEVFSSKSSRKPKTCFAFARAFIPHHTTLWHCPPPPRSSCGGVGSATSCGTWREVFCDTQGEEGPHTCSHHLHSGLVSGRQLPSFYWESSRAGPLQWWSVFLVYQRCRFPYLQVLLVPGPCHAQVCPSQLPSPHLAWGRRWVWKGVTSSSQKFSGSDLQQVMLFQTYGIQRCSHIPFVLCRL